MYIKINDAKYPCGDVREAGGGVVFPGVTGLDKPPMGVITLYRDDGFEMRADDAGAYKRVLLEGGTLTLTNEPEPTAPTIEELRTVKLNSLNGMCSGAIYQGVDINGTHYSFTQTAQGNIKGMLIEVQNGKTVFLYCADNEPLTTYTADEIKAIAQVMGEWISVNTVYYEQLKTWINRETDEVVLSTIHYGSQLPNDLMQELTTKLASVGVDITKYASMLEG